MVIDLDELAQRIGDAFDRVARTVSGTITGSVAQLLKAMSGSAKTPAPLGTGNAPKIPTPANAPGAASGQNPLNANTAAANQAQQTAALGNNPAGKTPSIAVQPPKGNQGAQGMQGALAAIEKMFATGISKAKVFGAVIGGTFEKLSSGAKTAFGSMMSGLNALQGGFQRMQGAFAQTVPLANPAAFIRYRLALDDLNAVIGQILLPTFEKFTASIRHLADFMISLPKPVKNALGAFATFSVAIVAAGGALALMAPLITAVTTGIGALVSIAGSLAGPLAIVGGILAGGVGIWAAYKTGLLDTLAAFGPLKGLMGTLKEMAQGMEGLFAGVLPIVAKVAALGIMGMEGLAKAMKPLVGLAQSLMKTLLPIGSTLLSALAPLVGVLSKIGDGLMGKVIGVANKIVASIGGMGAKLQAKIGPFIASILPSLEKIGNAIGKAFDAAQPAIDSFIEAAEEAFDLFLEYGLPAIEAAVKGLANTIEFLVPVFKVVVSAAKGMFDFMRAAFDGLGKMIDNFAAAFEEVYGAIRSAMSFVGVDLPEIKFKGGAGQVAPATDDFDKKTGEIEKMLKGLGELWKNPDKSSVGAAAKPAAFSSIEEYGRKATLAAFGAASAKPEDKIIDQLKRQQDEARRNAQAMVDAFNQAAANAAASALRGF